MANASLRALRWKWTMPLAVGFLAVTALTFGLRHHAWGQTTAKKPPTEKPTPAVFNDIMVPGAGGADQVAQINEVLAKGWKDNKLEPAERCSDYEFIRRASLDLIGRIAKVDEIEQFMRDPGEERRSRLIERLLASDEFAHNEANLWTTLLLTRTANEVIREQMHLWLFEEFQKKDSDWSKIVTELVSATGESSDKGQVNFILSHLGEEIKEDHAENGRFDMVPVTSRTTRLFLGLRTQCTQCHDHPFNDEWRQSHFWGINAFFRQVDAPNGRPGMMMKKKKEMVRSNLKLVDNKSFNTGGIVPYERRNGVVLFAKSTFLDGTKMPKDIKGTRRDELASLIVKSPYFAKEFVNRTWGHFFGRSFTKEPDDFGEHSPPSYPDLLNRLADDWANKYSHNPRDVIRWICNSKAYGLASVANPTNTASDSEPFFSRMLLKPMTPEQLFESLMVATQAKSGASDEGRKNKRKEWMSSLVVNFGDDEGNEASFNGTVVQALMLMNGKDINEAIMDKDYGTVANVLKKPGITPTKAMAELYMAALNRPPTAAEYNRILGNPETMRLLKVRQPARNDQKGWDAYYAGCYQDLFWAVLNSNEFFLNH